MVDEVTAVVVNFHGAADTVAAARAIADQGPGVRVTVVDNSESAQEVERLEAGLPAGAALIVAPRNLGFGRACNLALQRAPSPFLWLVNPDARPLPGCLRALRAALQADPALGAVAPQQFLEPACRWLFSPAWLPTAVDAYARVRAQGDARLRARYDAAVRAETLRLWRLTAADPPLRQRALSGSNLLLRTACLDDPLQPFDPAYFMYYEDSDLCMRLRRRRMGLAVIGAAQALHQWHLGRYKDALMRQTAPIYFARHFANSPWQRRIPRTPAHALPGADAWDAWRGEAWTVPARWREGWSIEISPTEYFGPAIGCTGAGPTVEWPSAVVAAMPGVRLHVRLGPLQGRGEVECRVIPPPA